MGVSYQAYLLPRRRSFVPTSTQIAEFVERFRASKWTHACFHRPAPRLHLTVEQGDRDGRERELRGPLTAAGVDALRRPSAPYAVDDELRIIVDVFWSTECVPAHVEQPDDDDDDEAMHERRILLVEDEHPRFYQLELLVARDFMTTWGNNIEDANTTRCTCDELLSYEPTDGRWPAIRKQHIREVCPKCSRGYDPSADTTRVTIDSGYERARDDVDPKTRDYARLASHLAIVLEFEKDWPVLPAGDYLTVDPELVQLCEDAFGETFDVVNIFC